ncbi:MAG TPA: substrate-binding domain-containing protein, partial [Tissierellaceae bacterium]|nr:substrate-binding domain-containing protein [Tissierellaceae bacterium]
MKRKIYLVLCLILAVVYMNGCSKSTNINLVSREEGSGTRSAFIEMVGLLEKSSKGNLEDLTSQEAIIQNSTEAIINTVAGDKNSIGYISLGSLNHRVKALKINDIPVSTENIKNNSYQIARPFNIVFKKDLKPLTQDFIDFILSQDGQNIINNEAYIPVDIKNHNYSPSQNQGSLVIAGSTSIYPVMEK